MYYCAVFIYGCIVGYMLLGFWKLEIVVCFFYMMKKRPSFGDGLLFGWLGRGGLFYCNAIKFKVLEFEGLVLCCCARPGVDAD